MVDSRRLLLFRTVVHAGSLSAAARELSWTQPAVSQQLAKFEREVGTPLLIRSSRGVTPTEAGKLLLTRAEAVSEHLKRATEELDDLVKLKVGRVRLVSFPSAAATLVPAALASLRELGPGIEVRLREAEPPEAWRLVRSGNADLAVVFSYDGPATEGDMSWIPLFEERLRLVVGPGHRLVGADSASLAQLRDEVWIAGCMRCRQNLVAQCHAAGFEPEINYESDDYVAVQSLVANGLGISLLPEMIFRSFQHPAVTVLDAEGSGRRDVGIILRPGAEQLPAVAALLGCFRELCAT